jgi:hypothetical protein
MPKPHIDCTSFGSITIDGTVFEHDVVIAANGAVRKRKKKLSKAIYGNSHTISLHEAEHVLAQGPRAERLIIGSGQYGRVHLSPEAAAYLDRRHCRTLLLPTPEAIEAWNTAEGKKPLGLFHVTC